MVQTVRVTAFASLALVTALGVGGCGSKSSTSGSASGSRSTSSSSTHHHKSHSSHSSSSSKTCPSSATKGTIGGKTKCLEVGQECSHKHASDYSQYGFSCVAKGNRYYLKKH